MILCAQNCNTHTYFIKTTINQTSKNLTDILDATHKHVSKSENVIQPTVSKITNKDASKTKAKNNYTWKNENIVKTTNHFPGPTREWKNAIYLYNGYNLNSIPWSDITANNIIKSYFSLYNKRSYYFLYKQLRRKMSWKKYLSNFSTKSLNKIFISNAEFKHTNSKVMIDLTIFNAERNNLLLAMQKLKKRVIKKFRLKAPSFFKRIKSLEKKSFRYIRVFNYRSLLEKKFLFNNKKNFFENKTISNYINICIRKYINRSLNYDYHRVLNYYVYKQMLFTNKYKYTYLYLQYLKEHLYKIYNKQIEFNLINLKHFFFNSDILSESILRKIKRRPRKFKRYMKNLTDKIITARKNTFLHKNIIKNNIIKKENLSESHVNLKEHIIKELKHKDITGFRLEAKGRLTKRFKASRSVLRTAHKGSLFNIDSSFKGLSCVVLRGNTDSNIQFGKTASKSRIGSFGLRCWTSSN